MCTGWRIVGLSGTYAARRRCTCPSVSSLSMSIARFVKPTRQWAVRLCASKHSVHLVDGFPVPVCYFRRVHFSQVFRGQGDVWPLRLESADLLRPQGHAADQRRGGVIRKTLPCLPLTCASAMRSLTWTCPPSRAHAWATKSLSARFSRRIWQARASTCPRHCAVI